MTNKKQTAILKNKVLQTLTEQGFTIEPYLQPPNHSKKTLKKIHEYGKNDSIKTHAKFLLENHQLVKEYGIDGSDIKVEEIKLELREVIPNSRESKIFLWWNLAWWSIPYAHPVGRQLRFIVWDKYHDAPLGLIGLSSPPLKMALRDNYLGIPSSKNHYWINMSLYGQRLGALPPYNEILGGKLIVLTLTSNQIRDVYSKKYKNKQTLKEKKTLPSQLLFTTTTSAFGKSSMYERTQYYGERVERFLGYTKGIGSFYLKSQLYDELIKYLNDVGRDTGNIPGAKSSRKIKLIHTAFDELGIKRFDGIGIKRGLYIFSNVNNLQNVIKNNKKPIWYDRPFDKISEYWLNRYAIPRSKRKNHFQKFELTKFIKKIKQQLEYSS